MKIQIEKNRFNSFSSWINFDVRPEIYSGFAVKIFIPINLTSSFLKKSTTDA